MNEDFINYLGLVPKNKVSDIKTKHAKSSHIKPSRRLFKFFTTIPVSIIASNVYLKTLTSSFEISKLDAGFKRINFIGFDYETYVNNDKYLDSYFEKTSKRRSVTAAEKIGLSRRARILKRELKPCEVKIPYLSIDDLLKHKLSKDTVQFILKNSKNSPNKTSRADIVYDQTEEEDQAILVETRLKEHLNTQHLCMYNNQHESLSEQINGRKNLDCDILFDNFDCENFYEQTTRNRKNSPKTKNDRQPVVPFRQINNSNNTTCEIEVIDLTDC